jgi:D-glycero-beta-D-manno-heptose-7-phosphate kinase
MTTTTYSERLLHTIDRLAGAAVGVVGDLVIDRYVSGQSDRVSREAPVLVLQYEQEWLRPGGAANVAANIAALGAKACVVGLVGDDEAGGQLLNLLKETGGASCDDMLKAPARETISKTRFLAGARLTSRQQVLRLDRQPDGPPDAALLLGLRERVARVDRQVAAWVVSDYGYGGFDDALRDLLREIAARKPVVADSRFDIHLFRGLTLVKPNEEEAKTAARKLGLPASDEPTLATALAEKLEAKAALVTLGNQGMVLTIRGGTDDSAGARTLRIPAVGTEEIVDLTGAGDSVAATLTASLAAGADIETACRLANHAGAVVVMKEGAATASPDELRTSVQKAAKEGERGRDGERQKQSS